MPGREPQLVDAVQVRRDPRPRPCRTSSSKAYAIAPTRSSTCSGKSFAASSSTPVRARSMSGTWCLMARISATPSLEATPSAISASPSVTPLSVRTFSRASVSRSSGTSFVAEQVDDELERLVDAERRRRRRAELPGLGARRAERRIVGFPVVHGSEKVADVTFDPSNELSAAGARPLIGNRSFASGVPAPPRIPRSGGGHDLRAPGRG